ncbi:hypothetical protein AGDE_13532 [Angomonas deanei]|nr:hypothetical protein AGDE_13532 [Angomonas deanei]|eukprot:EPY22156.1 hypothetical protein AGDE_13532 [Angomonas deanei]
MSSDHGEMLRLWEELRTLTDGKEEVASKKNAYEHKYPIVDKLIRLIEPKNSTVIKTPVGSRVLQSMIKYGSAEQLSKI